MTAKGMFERLVEMVAARVAEHMPKSVSKSAGRRGPSPRKGKKLDMSCRAPGCKNKSGGPRHGFMCKTHQKLSAGKQAEARARWNAAHA
jgi:hypothetical protein